MSYTHNDHSSNRTDLQTIENLRNNAQDQIRQGEQNLYHVNELLNNNQLDQDVIQVLEKVRKNAQDIVRKGQKYMHYYLWCQRVAENNQRVAENNQRVAESNQRIDISKVRASSSDDSPSFFRNILGLPPPRPKGRRSAYIYYSNELRPVFRVHSLYCKFTPQQTVAQLALWWNQLSLEAREPYEEMAKRDKERWQQEMDEYNARVLPVLQGSSSRRYGLRSQGKTIKYWAKDWVSEN